MKIPFFGKKSVEKPLPYRPTDIFGTNAPERSDFLVAFEQVSWINACVRLIANNVANATLRLYAPGQSEVDNHPVLKLLDTPNQFMTRNDLFSITVQQLELIGESFWLIVSGKRGLPSGLVPLNPSRMTQKMAGGIPESWEYETSGRKTRLEMQDVVFFRYPNPTNPWRGTSPLKAAALAADMDLFAAQWNRNFFYNSATPSGIFRTDSMLTDEEYVRLKSMIDKAYSGVKNAHKAILLENGLDFKPLSTSHRDMEFLEMRKFTRTEIASTFGVPLSKLGISDEVNRATAYINDYTFARNTLTPKLTMIADAITRGLLPAFKAEGYWFEFDSVIPQDTETTTSNLVSLVGAGILTPNEARAELGYEPIAQQEPEMTSEPKSVKKNFEFDQERYWYRLVESKQYTERDIKGWVAARFTQQERELKKRIKDMVNSKSEVPKEVVRKRAAELAAFLMGVDEQGIWRNYYEALFMHIVKEEATTFAGDFGLLIDLDHYDLRVIELIEKRGQRFARQVNETTYKQLQKVLTDTMLASGLNERDMVAAIENVMTLSRRQRAETIARTELFSAVNHSHQLTLEANGIEKKEWLAAVDERTRPAHVGANHQVVPTPAPFDVGGESLQYPGDPSGSPENIINCRCVLIPVIEGV